MSKFKRMNNNGLNVGTFVPTNANENVGTFVPTNAKRRGNRNGKLTPKIRGNLKILCQNLNEWTTMV